MCLPACKSGANMKSDVLTRFFFFESVKLLALSPSQSLFCLTNSPAGPLAHSIHSIPQQKMPTLTAQAGHVSVFQVSAPQTTRSVLAHLSLRHQGGKAWSNATTCMHLCCNVANRLHQRRRSPFTSLLLPYYICSPCVCESERFAYCPLLLTHHVSSSLKRRPV